MGCGGRRGGCSGHIYMKNEEEQQQKMYSHEKLLKYLSNQNTWMKYVMSAAKRDIKSKHDQN